MKDDGTPLSTVLDSRYDTMKVLITPMEIAPRTAAPDTAADTAGDISGDTAGNTAANSGGDTTDNFPVQTPEVSACPAACVAGWEPHLMPW